MTEHQYLKKKKPAIPAKTQLPPPIFIQKNVKPVKIAPLQKTVKPVKTVPVSKTAKQAKSVQSPRKVKAPLQFSEEEKVRLQSWKSDTRYRKLGEYSAYLWVCSATGSCSLPFIAEARKFLMPYQISKIAIKDYYTESKAPGTFLKKYGKYVYIRNDCYDYVLKVADQWLNPPSGGKNSKPVNRELPRFDAAGQDWSSTIAAPGFYMVQNKQQNKSEVCRPRHFGSE